MAASLQLTVTPVADSVNTEQNTSQLRVELVITTTGTTHNLTGDTRGTLTVGGTELSLDGKTFGKNAATVLYDDVHTVAHDADGGKTLTVTAVFDPMTPSAQSMTVTQTLTLQTVPRPSLLSASDTGITGVSLVVIRRYNRSYRHSIFWEFGALSGYLAADGSVSDTEQIFRQDKVEFAIPESFCHQIPDATQGLCRLTLRSYLEGQPVGDAQTATFTVRADPALCRPEVEGEVFDCDPVTAELTGDCNKLIRYASTAQCIIRANALYGSRLVQRTIQSQPVEEFLEIPQVSEGVFTFTATDSRGYTHSRSLVRELIPYIPLSANVTVRRLEPTSGRVEVTVQGSYYPGSFGAMENELYITCRDLVLTPQISGNSYTATGILTDLSYLHSHSITVTVTDRVGILSRTAVVGKGIPVFDWGEEDFRFHVPVSLPQPESPDQAVNREYLENFALPKAGGAMTGDIDFGENSVGLNWRTQDGTRFCLRPMYHQNVLQIGRIDPLGQGYATFNIDTQGYVHLYDKPLQISSGGTGGTDPISARAALGLGCQPLLAVPVESDTEQVIPADGSWSCFVVVGSPRSGGSLVSLVIPAEAVGSEPVRWQLADDGSFTSFYLSRQADTLTLAKHAGTGTITGLYGIN